MVTFIGCLRKETSCHLIIIIMRIIQPIRLLFYVLFSCSCILWPLTVCNMFHTLAKEQDDHHGFLSQIQLTSTVLYYVTCDNNIPTEYLYMIWLYNLVCKYIIEKQQCCWFCVELNTEDWVLSAWRVLLSQYVITLKCVFLLNFIYQF